jgi:putative DNA primase/helicase
MTEKLKYTPDSPIPEQPSTTFLHLAAEMAMRNIPVIPLVPRQKNTFLRDWPNLATIDLKQIEQWNRENPHYNCGAVAKPDGIWILDCDIATMPARIAEESGYDFPQTFTVRSSKGLHFYFHQTDASRHMGNRKVACVFDAQVNNKYVVAPGSIHPSGIRYAIVNDCEIVPAPDWLVEWIDKESRANTTSGNSAGSAPEQCVYEGGRDNFLFEQACRLRDAKLSQSDTLIALVQINREKCRPPMTDTVVRQKVESAFMREPRLTLQEQPALTDLGNAKRLVLAEGKDLHYCRGTKKWFVWDGQRWAKDDMGEIYRRAKKIVRAMLLEAAEIDDDKHREAFLKHQRQSESYQRLEAMIKMAETEDGIAIRLDDLDRDTMLFNCLNGTLDFRSGEVPEHRRDDLISKIAPVSYDRDAKCPGWLSFLDTVTDGNSELAAYLQRCVGYSLTGETIEHALFLLHGTGANGKSTFLEVLRHVFGEYARTADFSSFLLSKGQPIRNDLAKLNGARFVTATESEDGKRMAESVIKQMTGGDNVTARFLYSEHFEFKPAFKLWLGTNHKPVISGTDNGIWRRIRLIPFEVSIPPERQDRRLVEKLKLEGSGILNWAIEGLAAWKANGLQEPAVVKDATSEYRQEQDALMHFIAGRCELVEDARCQARDLYMNYRNWAMDAGEWFTMNERQFSQALSERGFKHVTPCGTKWWKGLRLKDDSDMLASIPPSEPPRHGTGQ